MKRKWLMYVVCFCMFVSTLLPVQFAYASPPSLYTLTVAQMNNASTSLVSSDRINLGLSVTQPERIYRLVVDSRGPGIELYMSSISTSADLDVALFNSSGVQLVNRNSTGTLSSVRASSNQSRVFRKICDLGTYYIRVFSRNYIYDSSFFLTVNRFDCFSGYGAYQNNIQSIAQRQDQWCWAACAEMIGKWAVKKETANDYSTSKTQENCASYLGKGNQPAYNYETIAAINYMTSGTPASSRGTVETGTLMLSQFNEQMFECGRAVAIQIASAYNGHLMVVRGTASGRDGLFLLDPWAAPITSSVRPAVAREVNRNDIIVNGDYASGGRRYVASITRTDW